MARPKIVLTWGPLGGLGDVLLYTTLPERYTALGYDVYLDADNCARNDEIIELWSKNPYVVGTSSEKPRIGYTKQGHFYQTAKRFYRSSIEMVERAHGLEPPYNMAPKIYYEPQPFNIDLSQMVLVDMSAVSSQLQPTGINGFLEHMGERFLGHKFVWVRFNEAIVNDPQGNMQGDCVRVNSIFEYIDAMGSCYAILCSEAGSQALAAAVRGEYDKYDLVRRPEICALISTQTYNSRGYTFRGVDYTVTLHSSNSTRDYWSPHEVEYELYQMKCRMTVEQAREQYRAAKAARDAAHTD